MYQEGLGVFEFSGCISSESEIWILKRIWLAHARGDLIFFTWSMAQGIRQGMSLLVPNICGNEFENEGAAWMATKWDFPILSLAADQ